MSTKTINISATGGNIVAKINCPKYPQIVAGVIWRYNEDQSFDKQAGVFNSDEPDVDLGSPSDVNGKYFLVEGSVLNQNDDPPTQFEVNVAIAQEDNQLTNEVPKDGGSGKISNKDIPFDYRFNLQSI